MVRRLFFTFSIAAPLAIVYAATHFVWAWWGFTLVGPVVLLGLYDVLQTRHSLLRIYPVIGHGRYFFEEMRPEIQQYFVESNIDGRPFSREFRSLIYQPSSGRSPTSWPRPSSAPAPRR